MTEYITGRQARELLDGATPGPWQAYDPGDGTARLYGDMNTCHYPEYDEDSRGVHLMHAVNGDWAVAASVYLKRPDGALAAAAPDLAATVAWLYGREPDGPGAHVHRGQTGEYDQEAVASHPEAGVVEVYAAHDHGQASAFLTPDEAVDLARALLAAAEEARHVDQ